MEIERTPITKTKCFPWVVGIVGALIIFFGSYAIGHGVGYSQGRADQKAKIDGKMVTYNGVIKSIKSAKDDLKLTVDKLNQARSDFTSNLDKYNELKDLQSKEEDMKTYVNSSKSTLDSLKSQIKDDQSKLATLQGDIVKAQGKPITLGAGHFTVGTDIPPSRYKVEPIGEGSNFSVWSSNGDLVLSTILGSDGVPSYVFEAVSGDKIENEAQAKLTSIK